MTAGRFSAPLFKLTSWLRAMGWTVELHADLPEDLRGRCHYKRRHLNVSGSQSAHHALMTLAHEGGHALSYMRHRTFDNRTIDFVRAEFRPRRERLAYLYGWALLKAIGCTIITKADWKEYHDDLLGSVALQPVGSETKR